MTGKQLGQFGWIHELACPSEDELYVAILKWRVQKLVGSGNEKRPCRPVLRIVGSSEVIRSKHDRPASRWP